MTIIDPPLPRRLLAEALGTFGLVGVGTGAVVLDTALDGALGGAGISLAFGLAVTAMILAFGSTSGAHINPAVTVALATAHRFPWRDVVPFAAAQALGAVAASLVVLAVAPDHPNLGATALAVGTGAGFAIEVGLTLLLMFTIFWITADDTRGLPVVAVVVGAAVAVLAYFGGPSTGASMNPARSLGPAVALGDLSTMWLYTAAPVLGACLALPVYRRLRPGPRHEETS